MYGTILKLGKKYDTVPYLFKIIKTKVYGNFAYSYSICIASVSQPPDTLTD
jgi:hypothetical protein